MESFSARNVWARGNDAKDRIQDTQPSIGRSRAPRAADDDLRTWHRGNCRRKFAQCRALALAPKAKGEDFTEFKIFRSEGPLGSPDFRLLQLCLGRWVQMTGEVDDASDALVAASPALHSAWLTLAS